MKTYPISSVADALGLHPNTLRAWERDGKIDPPGRRPGGARSYTMLDVERIKTYMLRTLAERNAD